MNDVTLSVQVIADMKALSEGLKTGTADIRKFVDISLPSLKELDKLLKGMGIGTSSQDIKAIAAASRQLNTEITGATTALLRQRIATEAQRTATAASRAQMAALNVTSGQSRTTMRALSGSYDETRQKMTALGREIRAAGGTINNTNPAVRAMIQEYNRLNDALKRVDAQMGNHQRNVGNYSAAISSAATALTGMISGYLSATALLQMAFTTALKTDAIKTSLEFTFNSVDVAKSKMDALRATANRLGLEYVSLADSYRSFAGAAIASNFPLKETDRIFNAVANAGAKMKLTTDQVSGALTALQQMISKGTVQSEELRGQLGERLPGAFAIAARAMGVTQQELGKMMKNGEVLAADLLPKLADELDKTFGNDQSERIESLGGSVNRVQNAFSELVETKGAVSGFFTFVVDRAGDAVTAITKMSQALGIFYDLATDPKKLIGDSARDSRSQSYETMKSDASSQAKTAVKNEGSKSLVLDRIKKEIDLLKELDAIYKKANEEYLKTKPGDRSLTDTNKIDDAEKALQSQILLVRGLKSEYDRVYAVVKPTVTELKSIAAIRKEITRLESVDGSSIKGSDVYNKIVALKGQLKELIGQPKKISNSLFDSVEKQIQEFQNKSSLITKEGLTKDLQEWDDKYNKIKAVIAKMPDGSRKATATTTLETNYEEGKTNIVEANTEKVMQAIKKRQNETALLQLDGNAKEIQSIQDKYLELIKLANGNKDAVIAIKKAETDEISALIEAQGAKDIKTSISQLSEIAKAYREHQAEIYLQIITGNPMAAEIAANQEAKDKIKQLYADKLIDYATYQSEMNKLVKDGEALDALKDMQTATGQALSTGVEGLISGTSEMIGGLLSGASSAGDAGAMLLGVIGNIAIQLGKSAIGIGVTMKAIKNAFTNPFTAIAAGVALIAIGSYINGTVAKMTSGETSSGSTGPGSISEGVPHFAMGIENFGGGLALVGERGPELVNIPTGSDVIPNHKVMQSIAGGNTSQVFIPDVKLKGQDLYVSFKRTEKANNRY